MLLGGGQGAAKRPRCTGQFPTAKNEPGTNIKSARVEHLCLKVTCLQPSWDLHSGTQTPSTGLIMLL